MRIAFAGSSGTGKTTLAEYIEDTFGLEYNPVGARTVSKLMGFESPYDVDKAGKRAEFQRRLVIEKCLWENTHDSFVTDRTTLDNIAYTMMHDVYSITDEILDHALLGLKRYTHIVYCPVDLFCVVDGDSSRVKDKTYQKLYDATLRGLLEKFSDKEPKIVPVSSLEDRKRWLNRLIEDTGGVWITGPEAKTLRHMLKEYGSTIATLPHQQRAIEKLGKY